MNRQDAWQWIEDHNVRIGDDPHNPSQTMSIVETWNTAQDPMFEEAMLALGIDPDNMGFSDEYTTCGECSDIIRTSPDCWGWRPDFWLDLEGGSYICNKCLQFCQEEYIESVLEEQRRNNKPLGCILEPEQLLAMGFVLKISDLENGLHLHSTDDPGAILHYCYEHFIDCIFTVIPSQFTQVFDVYMRKTAYMGEHKVLTEEELKAIDSDLLNGESLKPEYSNLRTGQMCKDALQGLSRGGSS